MNERATLLRKRDGAQLLQRRAFADCRRQFEQPIQPDVLGHGRVDQRVEIFVADRLQHFVDRGRVWPNVPAGEGIELVIQGRLRLLLRCGFLEQIRINLVHVGRYGARRGFQETGPKTPKYHARRTW